MARLDWSKANWPNSDPARVINVGIGWAPDQEVVSKRRKKRRKSKRKISMEIGRQTVQVASLIIPKRKAVLIASILRDLGRSHPSKRNRLNNWIKKLIDQGIILENGDIVRDHPLIKEWYSNLKNGTASK